MKYKLFRHLRTFLLFSSLLFYPFDLLASPILNVEPAVKAVNMGDSFILDISISGVTDLFAYQFDVSFDPSLLSAQSVIEGPFLSGYGSTYFIPGTIDDLAGFISFNADSLLTAISGADGSGVLAQLSFSAIATGTSPVTLSGVTLLDSTLSDIIADIGSGSVQVSNTSSSVPEPPIFTLLFIGFVGCFWNSAQNAKGKLMN